MFSTILQLNISVISCLEKSFIKRPVYFSVNTLGQ